MNTWGESVASLNKAMSDFINNQNLQGQAISSMRNYLVEVHGTLLQTLVNLMNDYSTNLLLYKDGYYQIDGDLHTKLPGQVFTNLHSALKSSRDDLKSEIELLNTTKDKISDLVSYDGSSHTSTVMDYNFLLNQIKNLDSSITQYESNHASQDLVAFKELLAATKALITEHAGKTRTVGTYQSGDFAKLKSVQRFAIAYKQATQQMESRVERVKAAQERDKVRFEALAAEDRAKNGWKDLAIGVVTVAFGILAIIGTMGTATPLVVAGGVVGFGTSVYGLSNVSEGIHNIELGNAGDIHTKSINPVRDTLFMGNDKLYHDVGNVFTTASAIMIPIGQTQSVVKGLTQFAIGEAGAYTAGQVAYHGTKLLGGSEEDAQTANFIGNIVGGYVASSAASKFSLNKVKVEVEAPKYNREQILKNLEESRLARESSKFENYLRKEYAQQGKYFPERITIPNGKRAYLSADVFEGKQVPVRSRDFVDAQGKIKWPPQGTDGFVLDSAGNPITQPANLKAGQVIDRFGSNGGRFASPVDNGEILPFNTRGLPYPEGHQVYHQYEVVKDINVENVKAGFSRLSDIDKMSLQAQLERFGKTLDDLANPQKGQIAKVFGQGGGVQIRFETTVKWYEKMGLLKEIK
ncbi:glycohydrolase toxin TNT-related protein [Streptococcus oralis]|uniref:glycohydrolase toxin TNT-related protein n=1 Tax=Streptococcus oralis TaxID=1303 RepID=UPI0022849F01|nr:glycohydrolase toxin TNT-related protein [Streptococcus oralis]